MEQEKCTNQDLIQLSFNSKGSAYFIYQIKVTRGIRGNTKGKVNEVLIVGIPKSAIEKYCIKNNLFITNKAVYEGDWNTPLLFLNEDGTCYKRKEDL